ncbi:putative PHD-finger-containing protein 1 [Homarus americanus]|uniref:Putative PHD-finger-containing protein 1 n=1 Tax=Homarus americanus TaxID=6706 RepID=A0A8J5JST1_HOMAM|nr:putative PHD-finger-containing protein 1 [Homarus americanus]
MSETKDSGDRRRKASVNKHGGKKNTEMCGECGLTVKDSDKAVSCDVCEVWFHIECEKLPEEVYNFMQDEEAEGVLMWYCSHCKKGCAKLHKYIKRIEQQQVEQMTRQNELEGKVNKLKEFTAQEHDKNKEIEVRMGILEAKSVEINDVLETNAKNDRGFENRLGTLEARTVGLEGKVDSSRATGSATEVKQEDNTGKPEPVGELIEELNERKMRENNIVVYGAPESGSPTMSERIESDKSYALNLIKECGITSGQEIIVKVIRLGKFIQGKARPMLIKLSTADIKANLFKNIRNLQGNMKFQDIRIANDLTKREREHEAVLWQEAKNLMDSGKGRHRVVGPPWRRRLVKIGVQEK